MSFADLLGPADRMRDLPSSEAFAELRAHVARLDLPEGRAVDWPHVQAVSTQLLRQQGKDLLLATYAAYAALIVDQSLAPADAVDFLRAFVQAFWDSMTPPKERPKARANCVAWFISRCKHLLPEQLPRLTDAQSQALAAAWRALTQTLEARLGPQAPSTAAILRLLQAPAARPSPAAARPAAAKPAAEVAEPARSGTAQRSEQTPQSGPDAAIDCRAAAHSLCLLAQKRRQIDRYDAQACRLWRVGLWLNVQAAPLEQNGRTRLVAVPQVVLRRLHEAARQHRWAQVHALAEETMLAHPLCLDLQYQAARALAHMGPTHAALARLVVQETQALCQRVPALLRLRASDGSALAAPDTQAWLRLQPPAQVAPPPAARADTRCGPPPLRRRFCRALKHAQRLVAQHQIDCAEAGFDRLAQLVERHRLDLWEPALACQVARGHLQALLAQSPRELPRVRGAFRRWAALDRRAAARHAGALLASDGDAARQVASPEPLMSVRPG